MVATMNLNKTIPGLGAGALNLRAISLNFNFKYCYPTVNFKAVILSLIREVSILHKLKWRGKYDCFILLPKVYSTDD